MAEAAPRKRGGRNRNYKKKIGQFELKLCRIYLYHQDGCNKGDKCDSLHICRGYMLKNCKSGRHCPFLHNLHFTQTREMFQRRFSIYHLEGETLRTFRELFTATLIKPTVDESLGEEESKYQIDQMKQKNQEELKKFLGSFSESSILPSSQREPLPSGAKPQIPQESLTVAPTATSPAQPKPPALLQLPQERQPEICSFYLKGSCTFSEQMHKHRDFRHYSEPFQWQIRQGTSGTWLDFTAEYNNLVEKDYRDVTHCVYIGKIIARSGSKCITLFEKLRIHFWGDSLAVTNVKGGGMWNIRRLSTASHAVEKIWQRTNSTHWTWYRQDDKDNWCEFVEEASPGNEDSNINSLILEKIYLNFKNKGGPSVLLRPTGLRKWHIDFSRMICKIISDQPECYVSQRSIARRPMMKNKENDVPRFQSDPVVRPKCVPLLQLPQPVMSVGERRSSRPSCSNDIPALLPTPKTAPTSHNQKESLYICPFFLRGRCKFDDDIYNHKRHFSIPYQWQHMDQTSRASDWLSFTQDENDSIEKSFCDATVYLYNCQSLDLTICFDEKPMTYALSGFKVRRLSTSSSVLKSSWETAFCTEWMWYWCDELGSWNLYSDQSAKGTQASTDSAAIEQQFVNFERTSGESVIEFTAGGQEYKLDFTAMHQTNVRYATVRQVRRRPKFVLMPERKQLSRELSEAQRSGIVVPSTWDNRGAQRDAMKLVPVNDATTSEYTDIAYLFRNTINNKGSIVSFERIQNTELWEDFTKIRERMKKKNGGKPATERRLFHGTSSRKQAEAICRQNFDWRLSGSNVGAIHGKGSYFARDASFAHSYTIADSLDYHYVLVAQVLIGTYAKGDPSYTRPPPKDPHKPFGDLYDSCVDNIHDPQIFVIFEKTQVYPEYLIKYKVKSHARQPTATVRIASIVRQNPIPPYPAPPRVAPPASTYSSTSPSSAFVGSASRPQMQPTLNQIRAKATASAQPQQNPYYYTGSTGPSSSSYQSKAQPSPTKEKSCTIQ